ncbi:class I SAM-dependent methyltransferase [Micromonospora aurantiaca (nom. illeg.)]|uniref:class I SAM-dependent methyltransferase n=1 Tax=Micromonospora aurantiaca (nom. illeg.) TaxID=47850 RepID=UPI0037A2FCFC
MTTTLPAHAGPIHLLLNPSIHTVLDRLDIRTNQRVLDVGASEESTTLLARLVGRYGSVTAVDADTGHLTDTAVINVHQLDLNRDPVPGHAAGYDHILARWPHGPLRDPADLIAQMTTRLRPGGWLVLADITTTAPGSPGRPTTSPPPSSTPSCSRPTAPSPARTARPGPPTPKPCCSATAWCSTASTPPPRPGPAPTPAAGSSPTSSLTCVPA